MRYVIQSGGQEVAPGCLAPYYALVPAGMGLRFDTRASAEFSARRAQARGVVIRYTVVAVPVELCPQCGVDPAGPAGNGRGLCRDCEADALRESVA